MIHHVLRGIHQPQQGGRKDQAEHREKQSHGHGHGHGGMHRAAYVVFIPGAEILGDNHRGARGQAHKEAHDQVNQIARSAAHCGQRLFAHIIAHHDGVHRVIELLEKGAQQNRKEKQQQLLPNHALGDPVFLHPGRFLFHLRHTRNSPLHA